MGQSIQGAIATFTMDALPYHYDHGLTVYLFFKTLDGEALKWFDILTAHDLQDFRTVEKKVLSQYSHQVPHKPTMGDLTAEKMRANEDFVTFASRWRDMAARSECYILESQAIEIIARNTTGALRAGLLVSDFHMYPQLYERVVRVLRNKDELPFLEPEEKGRKEGEISNTSLGT